MELKARNPIKGCRIFNNGISVPNPIRGCYTHYNEMKYMFPYISHTYSSIESWYTARSPLWRIVTRSRSVRLRSSPIPSPAVTEQQSTPAKDGQLPSGIEIPFTDTLRQNSVPFPFCLSKSEKEAVDSEIVKFVDKRRVEQVVHQEGEWISNLFIRPKPDGSYRLILDLTELNKYIEYEHFKMCSLHTALELVQQGKWMASIDLKDAYFSFLIRLQDRKLLRFIWGDCLYQFRCLPNGLVCAPRFFTKLLTPVFAKARLMGYDCFPFIDDSFIAADT